MWKTGTIVCRFVSSLLQPLLMPLYSVLLLFLYTNFFSVYQGQELRIILPVFIFTYALPALFIFILWKLRYIRNIDLYEQWERVFPYLIFMMANISLTYFFYTAGMFLWFLGLVIAPAFVALVGFIINYFWKISAHMMGMGGLIGGIFSVCYNVKGVNPFVLFILLFILAGCLGSARLYLKKSTAAQVYIGFIVGFFIAFISVLVAVFALTKAY